MSKSKPEKRRPLRYVRYGRASTEHNPCSVDQQLESIKLSSQMQGGVEGTHVGDFCDDGLSGRDPIKRRKLRRLLEQIRSGQLRIDAILVESLERLGRKDFQAICVELEKHGVMLLIADIRRS